MESLTSRRPLAPRKWTAPACEPRIGVRSREEEDALSKALSLAKNTGGAPPKPTPPDTRRRSLSAGKSRFPEPRFKSRTLKRDPQPKEKKSSSSTSLSIWNWKPLRALSRIRHRRFDCHFTLHVHSVEGLPPSFDNADLCINWKRNAAEAGLRTRPARVSYGVAIFEETLEHRCAVYGSRGRSAKYEARPFVLYPAVVGARDVDLGEHWVDCTRLLPLRLEELEEGASGNCSTTFRLSGKARGASLHVSFGFSLLGGQCLVEPGGDRKALELLLAEADGAVERVDLQKALRRVGSVPAPTLQSKGRLPLPSLRVDDVKVVHEVLPISRNCDDCQMDNLVDSLKPALKALSQQYRSPVLSSVPLPEMVKVGVEFEDREFTVIEQGIEIATKDRIGVQDGLGEHVEPRKVDKGERLELEDDTALNDELKEVDQRYRPDSDETFAELDAVGGVLSVSDLSHPEDNVPVTEPVMEELNSAFQNLSIFESVGLGSLKAEARALDQPSYKEIKSNYKLGKINKSMSLDYVTEPVASDFLSMLGIERSPFGLSSDSDPESPRERLWKQFKRESLANGENILDLDVESDEEPQWKFDTEDTDLSSIVHAAESFDHKALQAMKSKTRAKMLEDAEAEVLMHEWGLNEKAFQKSPPGSAGGFGSPIELPPEDPSDLPPLGDGLGPLVQTKDGGFLRSMNPSLFRNSKSNVSLIMQASCPVVLPAEMGSSITEILLHLTSGGIKKLSMQASKLMPLQDITGKTIHQVAWEAGPALEACERRTFFHHLKAEGESGLGRNAVGKGNVGKTSNLSSSDYVSLEDLAPLAMIKIEALSIEGLRIQTGMSDEDASSNIGSQLAGENSNMGGKKVDNFRSFGFEGAAGMQLLDVKDNNDDVDGLMDLSITLDEWMRLDSGLFDEEDQISDRTSKILAAHHASFAGLVSGGWKGDRKAVKNSGRKWGLLGSNFMAALMVQLRDPLRNFEPVGTPMLALIQVERALIPPKPKIYSTISYQGNSEQDEESEMDVNSPRQKEKKEAEQETVPQFIITQVHVAGVKSDPGKKKIWGNAMQEQSGSRWLLASGMGKRNKNPFMKLRPITKPSQGTTQQLTTAVQPGDTLWSISSCVHGTGTKWKELAALNPHIRNPNIIVPNETIRLQ